MAIPFKTSIEGLRCTLKLNAMQALFSLFSHNIAELRVLFDSADLRKSNCQEVDQVTSRDRLASRYPFPHSRSGSSLLAIVLKNDINVYAVTFISSKLILMFL